MRAKYNLDNQKEKAVRIRLFNIVIYPENLQSTERYIQLFSEIKSRQIQINTYSDKMTRIRTQFFRDGIMYGHLINYTKLNQEGWFNDETYEIEDVDIDRHLNPNSKEWDYYFLPEVHRLAILDNAKTSPSQITKFFSDALNTVCDKEAEEEVKISSVSTEDVIEQIFTAEKLTHLEIKVSYSNNDNNDGWDNIIDTQMKECKVSDLATKATGTKKKPILLNKNTFLGGMLSLSRENGYAKATLFKNGNRVVVNTKEHPLISEVRYDETIELSLLNRIKECILNLAHR